MARKAKKHIPWDKIKLEYAVDLSLLEAEIRHDELQRVMADPATRLLDRPLREVQHLVHLALERNSEGVYKRGFRDALTTIKDVAETQIKRL